jgi:hypothetical protein
LGRIDSRMEECHRHHRSFTGNWFARSELMQARTPSISSDGKPQLCKRHIPTNSSIDATIQRWIAAQDFTGL